jgi:cell division transport system permease protein
LKLLNLIIFIFVAFAGLSALLLITKQMQIWTYEHQERMYVMNLFGASFWQKSSPLYKSAVLDAILAMLLAGCVFAVLPHIGAVQDVFSEIGVGVPAFVPHQDGSLLLVISLIVAIISTSIAMTKVKQV